MAAGDWDGDGLTEIGLGYTSGYSASPVGAALYRAPLTGEVTSEQAVVVFSIEYGPEAWGHHESVGVLLIPDRNGDTEPELAIVEEGNHYGHSSNGHDFGYLRVFHSPLAPMYQERLCEEDLLIYIEQGVRSVGAGRDLTGDGHDDLLIGAPYGDDRDPWTGAWIVSTADLREGTLEDQAYRVQRGEDSEGLLGYAVDTVDDFDGDGLADLLISDPSQRDESPAGTVYVVRGPFRGPVELADADYVLSGAEPNDSFGASAAFVSNPDNSGFGGVLVGAPRVDDSEADVGAVYLFTQLHEGAQGSEGASLQLRGGGERHHAGEAVDNAGDVNGDGTDDLVIGAPGEQPSSSYGSCLGGAYLVLAPYEGSHLLRDVGTRYGARGLAEDFGATVTGLGDTDGDGFPDVAIGGDGLVMLVRGPG